MMESDDVTKFAGRIVDIYHKLCNFSTDKLPEGEKLKSLSNNTKNRL